jgi:predicted transcriptional regulator
MNQTLTIRIPDDLKRELEKLSKTEEKPVSDLVRDSLKRYIAIHRFRQLRNTVLPFAEAQGILTDEDVFKLVGKSR